MPEQTQKVVSNTISIYGQVDDFMPRAVENAGKGNPIETPVLSVYIACDDGGSKDPSAGQVGVEVNISRKDETFVVIIGVGRKGEQVCDICDLVWIVRLARSAVAFGRPHQLRIINAVINAPHLYEVPANETASLFHLFIRQRNAITIIRPATSRK